VSRVAPAVFAFLVLATFGAFFVVQRLKQAPRPVKTLTVTDAFSPRFGNVNASIRIRITDSDDVTVSILDSDGDVVRRLVRNQPLRAGVRRQYLWNGRDDDGRIVPDGTYRIRVALRGEGRSVVLLESVDTDATPPRPAVEVERPERATGPLILPARGSAPVRFELAGATANRLEFGVYRTDGPRVVGVASLPVAPGATSGTWDGRIRGRPAPAGTYVIVARVRDQVGNVGASYPFGPRRRGSFPGVTVRHLAGQGPTAAAAAGKLATVFVDARGLRYRWRLHRLGQVPTLAKGIAAGPALRFRVPVKAASGVYVVELDSGSPRTRGGPQHVSVPLLIQSRRRHPVLVVIPYLTWQGRNRLDDDGDGLPDTLEAGSRNPRLARPFVPGGAPRGLSVSEGPLLRLLDRPRQDYDVQTDVALARAGPRELTRHRGIVLLGDVRWVEPAFGARLKRYVSGGGRVFLTNGDVLRRQIRVRGARLRGEAGASAFDAFGATLSPPERGDAELLAGDDAVKLFEGTDGAFEGFTVKEETLEAGPGARVVSAASATNGEPVIVAVRLGRGLIVRTGLPQWPARLADPNVDALTRRAWSLLSR